ncbi:hypothetical protein [Caniella muris]|uniref:hypothetical protein n=1 Tax=Caniella muris TaxID=2941502 RepID=UPI00203EEE48|nr:hypothetical protein [Caniella muris]
MAHIEGFPYLDGRDVDGCVARVAAGTLSPLAAALLLEEACDHPLTGRAEKRLAAALCALAGAGKEAA